MADQIIKCVCIFIIVLLILLIIRKIYIKISTLLKKDTDQINIIGESKPCITELKRVAELIVKDVNLKNRKLKIFEILANTSKEFLTSLDPNGGKVERMLSSITRELNFDRGYLFKINKNNRTFELTYSYGEFDGSRTTVLTCDMHTSLYQTLARGINITSCVDMALVSRNAFGNVGSIILIPIFVGNNFTGFMGFDADREKIWDEIEVNSLKIVTEIFGAWCDRRKASSILEQENMMLKSV